MRLIVIVTMMMMLNQVSGDEDALIGPEVLRVMVKTIVVGPEDGEDVPDDAEAEEGDVGENGPGEVLDGADDADDTWETFTAVAQNIIFIFIRELSPAARLKSPARMMRAMPVSLTALTSVSRSAK